MHICNLAAQTGVTRFTQINDNWMYSKNESLTLEQLQEYTHLIVEAKSKYSPNLKYFMQSHIILDSIESFSQIAVNYKLLPPVKIKTKPAIFILERQNFREYPYGHNTIDSASAQFEEYSSDLMSKDENSKEFTENEVPDVISKEEIENALILEVETTDAKNNGILETESNIGQEKYHSVVTSVSEEAQVDISKENAKKAIDELKTLRQERKKRAIEKIKTETRKEVVASAKEKLKEIMKRHKHIADELSESIIPDIINDTEQDGRGDIPELELAPEEEIVNQELETQPKSETVTNMIEVEEITPINENVNSIVEEVIVRLIDRKIYDDKTKPEDIKSEDRLIIQKIVEEVLSERMNYVKSENN